MTENKNNEDGPHEEMQPQGTVHDESISKEETEALIEDIETEILHPKDIEIGGLKNQVEELKDKYLRLYADFDNFKKRNAKERIELIQTAGKDVIKDMLPVLDDLERALKSLETNQDFNTAKEGMMLIAQKLSNTLSAKGLKPMESIGKPFDIEQHEAITEIPSPTAEMSGKVMDEVEKGYFLNDKIIRFAKVVVGK